MNKATVRKKQPSIGIKNPLEAGQNIAKDIVNSVATDVVKSGVSDFWKQVLTTGNSATNSEINGYHKVRSGDLSEGEELILSNQKRGQEAKTIEIEAGEVAVEYKREILHGESRAIRKISQEIETKTQEILAEIKRLIQTTKEIQVEFREVAAEQRVVKPGKYHQSFFEWVLVVIRQARMKVEDSNVWLTAFKNKQGKKDYYWTMSRVDKGGTSFQLSNERVVATQTG